MPATMLHTFMLYTCIHTCIHSCLPRCYIHSTHAAHTAYMWRCSKAKHYNRVRHRCKMGMQARIYIWGWTMSAICRAANAWSAGLHRDVDMCLCLVMDVYMCLCLVMDVDTCLCLRWPHRYACIYTCMSTNMSHVADECSYTTMIQATCTNATLCTMFIPVITMATVRSCEAPACGSEYHGNHGDREDDEDHGKGPKANIHENTCKVGRVRVSRSTVLLRQGTTPVRACMYVYKAVCTWTGMAPAHGYHEQPGMDPSCHATHDPHTRHTWAMRRRKRLLVLPITTRWAYITLRVMLLIRR